MWKVWVGGILTQRKKKKKVTEVLHFGSVCDDGAVALGDSLYLWVVTGFTWLLVGTTWDLLSELSPVRAVCSGLCSICMTSQVSLVHSWSPSVKNKFFRWVGIFFVPACVCCPLCCASLCRVCLYLLSAFTLGSWRQQEGLPFPFWRLNKPSFFSLSLYVICLIPLAIWTALHQTWFCVSLSLL